MFFNQKGKLSRVVKIGASMLITAALVFYPYTDVMAEWYGEVNDEDWEVSEPVQYTISHKVRSGETLWDLSRAYEVDTGILAAMNDLEPDATIQVGQMLRMPAEQTLVHEVAKGETLWEIAQYYGIKPELIIWENDIEDESLIVAGQSLSISLPIGRQVLKQLDKGRTSRGIVDELLAWPAQGVISSRFGLRWGRRHLGLDIAADEGEPVRAVMDGVVSFAGPRGTFGKLVILEHSEGLETYYGHNSKVLVSEGERITKGQLIARVGNTGRSTGPHLHFEMRRDGVAINPERYLPEEQTVAQIGE